MAGQQKRIWMLVSAIILQGFLSSYAQLTPGGFVKVTDSSKVNVVLDCGAKYMSVQLIFNSTLTPQFYDWIVVGSSNKPECRLRGNGQNKYIIEIPIMKDPCGTQMYDPGTFENIIRIGQKPLIILRGDELVTVRCVYGLPEIGTPNFPEFPSTQPYFPQPTRPTLPPVPFDKPPKKAQPGIILLIVFLILFLALLFLLCGCLYFFFKRRKLRVERRKKLILAVPPGSELHKVGLSHLWWSGKSSLSNDALLNHDYMLSGNSTREGGLSVSTDYAGDTPSSTSSGSPGHPAPSGSPPYNNQMYVHESKHIQLPRAHIDGHDGRAHGPGHSLHSIPEERRLTMEETLQKETVTTVIREKRHDPRDQNNPQYASVDVHTKRRNLDLDSVEMMSKNGEKAVSEIYTTTGNERIEGNGTEDSRSIASTLEGKQYDEDQTRIQGLDMDDGATIAADVHATEILRESAHMESDREWTEEFVTVVEQHRSSGNRRLTDQEINRWRHLVENDENIQERLRKSRTLEEFESISRHPRYENLFPSEKWAIIVQSLAHVTFLRRLTEIIDTKHDDDAASGLDSASTKRRYMKKNESGAVPKRLNAEELTERDAKEQRLFTRESYYRVKEDIEYHSDVHSEDERRNRPAKISDGRTDYMNDRGSTEFTEGVPMVRGSSGSIDRPPPPSVTRNARGVQPSAYSVGETDQFPPTLHVYVGNVAERASMRRQAVPYASTAQGTNNSMYGTSTTYDNWQSNADEL